MSGAALVRQGYRRARAVARRCAKSFYFASFTLFGARRRAAFALYAFCRRLDDLVDDGRTSGLEARLADARALISRMYRPAPLLPAGEHAAELAALADTVRRFSIPEAPFQDLVSGMEMDLVRKRYATYEALDLYCYRVAGTVGLMLAPVLGCSAEWALGPAADLGRAMQLTNILRDVKEDLARGRVYLPEDELRAFGLSDDDLAAGRVDERWRAFMRFQIARARALYARAERGIPELKAFGAQRMVRLMSAVYGDILRAIERADYDVFSARVFVPGPRKLALLLRVLFAPKPRRGSGGPTLPRLPAAAGAGHE
ncbi:MAG: phytoene/squalene synthase family protein [Myxococcales bacterium]